jgi:hypothetical protein
MRFIQLKLYPEIVEHYSIFNDYNIGVINLLQKRSLTFKDIAWWKII